MDVVVRPGAPVSGDPGGLSLRVEGSRGGIVLVRVDGNSRVAVSLQESSPRLISLVPVASGLGIEPVSAAMKTSSDIQSLNELGHNR